MLAFHHVKYDESKIPCAISFPVYARETFCSVLNSIHVISLKREVVGLHIPRLVQYCQKPVQTSVILFGDYRRLIHFTLSKFHHVTR